MVVNLHQNPTLKSLSQRDWPREFVYIGRAGRGFTGEFGNPVKTGETCSVCGKIHSRPGDTIECYRAWLEKEVVENQEFREKVARLAGKTLVCFCVPRPCHGNVLEEIAERLSAEVDTPEDTP